ncbi:MAG TPA: conjugal transfer protein TraG [Ruminococcaceae bacterium]|nr:conjugal transfer protein TraG [Oscillospiraceae bacterium]
MSMHEIRQTKGWRIAGMLVPFGLTAWMTFYTMQVLRPYCIGIFPTFSFQQKLLISAAAGFLLTALLHTRHRAFAGKEHGSARWGKHSDIKPFLDKNPMNDIILSQTERLSLDQHLHPGLANNVLVIGDTGAGKSRFYAKPNIMQMNASYVITDPSGEHLASEGKMLEANGYKIKVFDITDPKNSLHFNPFHYYKGPKDVRDFIDVLMENTTGDTSNPHSTDDFWVKSERLWFSAHINYVLETCAPEEQNIPSVMKLLNASEVRDEDDDFVSAIDILFQKLEAQNPQSFACLQYKKFKLAAGKTAKSILISVAIRMQDFDIQEFSNLFSEDELHLEMLGQEKTALFLIMEETSPTYNYMIALVLSVLFNVQVKVAKQQSSRKLPIRLRCIIDEIANIGKFPHFENLLATLRKYEVSFEPIYQDIGQIKHQYKDSFSTILSCCPTKLFLGGTGEETTKYVSEQMLGDATIATKSSGDSASGTMGKNSHSENEQSAGRKLLDITEVASLPPDECIVKIKGLPPFRSKKYDLTVHPNYKLLADDPNTKGYAFHREQQGQAVTLQMNYITEIELEDE